MCNLGVFLGLLHIPSVDQKQIKKQIKEERRTYAEAPVWLSLPALHSVCLSFTHTHTHAQALIRAVQTEKVISLLGGTALTGRRDVCRKLYGFLKLWIHFSEVILDGLAAIYVECRLLISFYKGICLTELKHEAKMKQWRRKAWFLR